MVDMGVGAPVIRKYVAQNDQEEQIFHKNDFKSSNIDEQ